MSTNRFSCVLSSVETQYFLRLILSFHPAFRDAMNRRLYISLDCKGRMGILLIFREKEGRMEILQG